MKLFLKGQIFIILPLNHFNFCSKDLEFGRLTCKDIYFLNITDYLNFMESLDFPEQQKIIQDYLKWYLNLKDREVFSKSIVKRKDFEYNRVVLSPDCTKLAVYDSTQFLSIFDLKTNRQIVRFQTDLRNNKYDYTSFMLFSFDSRKLVFDDNVLLVVFNTETLVFEKKYEKLYFRFCFYSKSDYTLAFLTGDTILIRKKTKISKKQKQETVLTSLQNILTFVVIHANIISLYGTLI